MSQGCTDFLVMQYKDALFEGFGIPFEETQDTEDDGAIMDEVAEEEEEEEVANDKANDEDP